MVRDDECLAGIVPEIIRSLQNTPNMIFPLKKGTKNSSQCEKKCMWLLFCCGCITAGKRWWQAYAKHKEERRRYKMKR